MWTGLTITVFLWNIIVTILAIQFYKQLPEKKIYNLFYEINHRSEICRYDFRSTYYYSGVIKTLFPNGTEKIIWKSEREYTNKDKCEEDTKLRYKFLCDYYGTKFTEREK